MSSADYGEDIFKLEHFNLNTRKSKIIVLCICLLALFLYQLAALNLYEFSDEKSFLQNVESFVKNKNIIPVYTNYPTFFSYIITIPIYLTYILSILLKGFPISSFQDIILFDFIFTEFTGNWLKVSRLISMLFSIITIAIILTKSIQRYSIHCIVMIATLLICDPFGIYFSHAIYGLPDVPVACMVTLSIFLCYQYLDTKEFKFLYIASIVAGLGASMKLNGALMIFPLISTFFVERTFSDQNISKIFKVCGLFFIGFFLGSPVWLFSPSIYFEGFMYEINMLTKTGWIGSTDINWIWLPIHLWKSEPIIFSLFLSSIIFALIKKNSKNILYLVLLFFSILILGALKKKTLTYFIFLYPVTVYHFGEFYEWIRFKLHNRPLKNLFSTIVLICIILLSGNKLIKRLETFNVTDNRVVARKWIEENIQDGKHILLDKAYVPKLYIKDGLNQYLDMINSSSLKFKNKIKSYYQNKPSYHVTRLDDPVSNSCKIIQEKNVDYFIASSSYFNRFLVGDQTIMKYKKSSLFNTYINGRKFYNSLLNEQCGYFKMKTFSQFNGP